MNNLMIPLSEQSEQDLSFMDAAVEMVRFLSPHLSTRYPQAELILLLLW